MERLEASGHLNQTEDSRFRHFFSSGFVERRVRCKGKVVYASLFGVGAPEALVIGVVALLVFGPKGLAEEVSREFKSTLEREIGLDDISKENTYSSSRPSSTSTPSSTTSTEGSQPVDDPSE
ncbi:Sec-independent protein translocase protein TATB, chloroplastic [Morella rubra]|uniref:Sec-independent protein translocase protein TATB, chloroplastic n=1 Tax=Morella rubra TaxID=262757 RepID=A0A6A1UYH3_9ROSI|nr:Sec-independent protein translocase protein TATB, chloroplastic [Morella rubra]